MKDKIEPPALLREFAGFFTRAGFSVYMVGGAVRDYFRGRPAEDWDVATDAMPGDVIRLFRRVIPTGIAHGTVTVLFKGRKIECTTFRTETGYSDSRHPDHVQLGRVPVEDDLSRRDFTMNAIAVRLPDGAVVDPFGGREAIRNRRISAVGNPLERFSEDGLRPLRCVRFAAQTGFTVDGETLAAIPSCLSATAAVSQERIRDELQKMLAAPRPSDAFRLMEQTGLLALILPELAACRGVLQLGFHRDDVLDHLFLSCDLAAPDDPEVRLAALLHDTGKPFCREWNPEKGRFSFYRHEEKSAELAQSILTRLRFPRKTVEFVAHLVKNHMFRYTPDWSDAAVRRFLVRVGAENIPALFRLRAADFASTSAKTEEEARALVREQPETAGLARRIGQEMQAHAVLSLKDLCVNGRDLQAEGIPAGPLMGKVMQSLFSAVLEDPGRNRKENLLEMAKTVYTRLSEK